MAVNCEKLLEKCNVNCREYLGGQRELKCIRECFSEYGRCLAERKADWWRLVRVTVTPGQTIDPRKIAAAVGKGFTDALTEKLIRSQKRELKSKRLRRT